MSLTREKRFPLGAEVSEAELHADPFVVFERLRKTEPISWIKCLNMYYVLNYGDVDNILKNNIDFVVGTENSTNFDTFGAHMLTVEGEEQERYKSRLRRPFMPKFIREHIEAQVRAHVDGLIDGFAPHGQTEFRKSFAARLPVQVMLSLFGFPEEDEIHLRRWYDSFEAALANFTWKADVRATAKASVTEFHAHLQERIEHFRRQPDVAALLSTLANMPEAERLTDAEIKHNLSIIFFGGISTVEGLLLNTFYALSLHPEIFERVRQDHKLIPQTLEETIRWMAPVQSATRHVAHDVVFNGIEFKAGDTVNCMLGAANRDPAMFENPGIFNIDRRNLNRHVGFVVGPHHCLGSNLARSEGRIALERLLARLPNCRMNPENITHPQGYEFLQPNRLDLIWSV